MDELQAHASGHQDEAHEHPASLSTAIMAAGGGLLAGVIALRLADGSASALVQSWYLPVLVGTCALLFAFAAHAGYRAFRDGVAVRPEVGVRSMFAGAVIASPIVIALIFQPAPLGSANLDSSANISNRFSESARSGSGERNVYQWAYQFETAPVSELAGQEFSAIGFVYHRAEAPAGTFEIARFVVACCVADAIGFTLPVQWPAAGDLPADSWVRVQGQVSTDPGGRPIVVAKVVERIDPPSNPYIYP